MSAGTQGWHFGKRAEAGSKTAPWLQPAGILGPSLLFLPHPASAARGAFSSWPESCQVSALTETSLSSAPCSPRATAPGFV